MSHQTKRPFDSVECSTPHDLLIRCSLSNLQFPAIALTWCGFTSHRHRSIEPFFLSLAHRPLHFCALSGGGGCGGRVVWGCAVAPRGVGGMGVPRHLDGHSPEAQRWAHCSVVSL